MNLVVLYLLLAKATLTSFSGLTSLPVIRQDLVEKYHVLTDTQLSAAVAAGRVGPGPAGLYVVSVGYFVAGVPGACAGWLAMITPAFLILPMIRYLGSRADHPAVKSITQCVTLAASGLLLSMTVSLVRQSLQGPLPLAIATTSAFLLSVTRIDTAWVILGAAAAGLCGALFC